MRIDCTDLIFSRPPRAWMFFATSSSAVGACAPSAAAAARPAISHPNRFLSIEVPPFSGRLYPTLRERGGCRRARRAGRRAKARPKTIGFAHASIEDLPTPSVLVDLDVLESNVRAMQERAREAGLKLRPHAKTHKSPEVGRLQLAAGAAGLTLAKTSEAEVFASLGLRGHLPRISDLRRGQGPAAARALGPHPSGRRRRQRGRSEESGRRLPRRRAAAAGAPEDRLRLSPRRRRARGGRRGGDEDRGRCPASRFPESSLTAARATRAARRRKSPRPDTSRGASSPRRPTRSARPGCPSRRSPSARPPRPAPACRSAASRRRGPGPTSTTTSPRSSSEAAGSRTAP